MDIQTRVTFAKVTANRLSQCLCPFVSRHMPVSVFVCRHLFSSLVVADKYAIHLGTHKHTHARTHARLKSTLHIGLSPNDNAWLVLIENINKYQIKCDGELLRISMFCPHTVFMCFVWISEQKAIISLYNIN